MSLYTRIKTLPV